MAEVLFGTVKDNVDPEKLGRVQVLLSDHGEEVILPWIRVVQHMATANAGLFWIPEIEDNVVVLKGPGGVDGMVVLGALYSGNRKPAGEAKVEHKHLLTAAGNEILIDDTSGSELIRVNTKDSKLEILLEQATPGITITAGTELTINCDDKVVVNGKTIEIKGSGEVTISGTNSVGIDGGEIEIKGTGTVKVSGAMVELG